MPQAVPRSDSVLQLRRESTAQQVAGALRELIVNGGLPSGEHLREAALAQQLGVSRNTVREAVQILVSDGLVTRELHRGAYVARLTEDDVRDLFRVRRLVELTAIREIAGSKETGPLKEAIQSLSTAAQSGDRRVTSEADLEFHRRLVALMDSERLGALYDGVDAEIQLCIARATPASVDPSSLIKDHKAIVAALARGDAATASKRLERHFDESERLLIESLEPTPLPSAQVSSAEA
jgi:DNA-binding GntR family transcriptional regulator